MRRAVAPASVGRVHAHVTAGQRRWTAGGSEAAGIGWRVAAARGSAKLSRGPEEPMHPHE